MTFVRFCLAVLAAAFALSSPLRAEVALDYQNLKPHQAWSKIKREGTILIDVRTPAEWRATGVPETARLITLAAGKAAFVKGVAKAVRGDNRIPVAVICRTGTRSAQAAEILVQAGFKTVYNVQEGVVGNGSDTGWAMRGLPMVSCGACTPQN